MTHELNYTYKNIKRQKQIQNMTFLCYICYLRCQNRKALEKEKGKRQGRGKSLTAYIELYLGYFELSQIWAQIIQGEQVKTLLWGGNRSKKIDIHIALFP